MSRIYLFVVLGMCFLNGFAQRSQGSWQDYLSFSNASKVCAGNHRIYCATEGGVFYYDLDDNSVNKLDSHVQLSDFGIQTIAYNSELQMLVIAYTNSNIDLIDKDGQTFNLSDIKRKTLSSNKQIHQIVFHNHLAYLACGFGIVAIDLNKKEIKDTYIIGENGSYVQVNDVAIWDNSITAATDQGILQAPLEGANLLDYSVWVENTDIPHPGQRFNLLEVRGNSLFANYAPNSSNHELYRLTENNWESFLASAQTINDLQSMNGYLIITGKKAVYLVDKNNTLTFTLNKYSFPDGEVTDINPTSALLTNDNTLWVADAEEVLAKINNDQAERIIPDGPVTNEMYFISHTGNELWIAPGDLSGYKRPFFQRNKEGQWTYFLPRNHPELNGFHNILEIAVDPADANHFFVASWGGGLLEYRNDEFVQRFYNKNSPLETALPNQPDQPFTRVGGLAFDQQGNLWMTNAECTHNLHRLAPNGEWTSYSLPEIANLYNVTKLIVNQYGDKWMLVPGHDAYVVDQSGERKKRLLITTYFNNGTEEFFTRMNDAFAIAEDQNGEIWIGTSMGVAVYSNPSRIWESDNFYAYQPGLDLNDGYYHPLLETESVTAIAIDGANRKWLGTKNSGVFLVSETGEKEILHFTAENSPLLSNSILSITLNTKTGEVFFGTNKGLISYQGDAPAGNNNYDNVYVYPNPVRETYNGPITITGLIDKSDVKITDISGNLVYKTTSLGSQATWDGKNLNGHRVKTGVYLVFCNDQYGEETVITKILFIH